MRSYEDIKDLAAGMGVKVDELLALARENDPFYAEQPCRAKWAEWFAELYGKYAGGDPHIRKIHYVLVSKPGGRAILKPDGKVYKNTSNDWTYLARASKDARYLGLIPADGLVDRRNNGTMIFADGADPADMLPARSEVVGDYFDAPDVEMPTGPFVALNGLSMAIQDYAVEIWIEKSTCNKWLIPLCECREINLTVGTGEQSEINCRKLARRAAEHEVPTRVLYVSDFDPGGKSMPNAVARKVEYALHQEGLYADIQLIPVALSQQQCIEYKLPRIPIKGTEARKGTFEGTYGAGATELDALEALHPGGLERILNEEIDNFLDPTLLDRVRAAHWEAEKRISGASEDIDDAFADEADELEEEMEDIKPQVEEWSRRVDDFQRRKGEALEAEREKVDLSDIEVPRADVIGQTDRFVLFDSERDEYDQLDYYKLWKGGAE